MAFADLSGRWLLLGFRVLFGAEVEEDGVDADGAPGETATRLGDEAPNKAATCEGDEKLDELAVWLEDA